MKKKLSKKSNWIRGELIDRDSSIEITENHIAIRINRASEAKAILGFFTGGILLVVFFFFYGFQYNPIGAIIFILLFLFILFPFLISYFLLKNKITEMIFDKSKQKIIYNKISHRKRKQKEFFISEINYFYYKHGITDSYLYLVLNSGKEMLIYFGTHGEKCEEVGLILGNFLQIPLYYKKSRHSGLKEIINKN